MYALSYIYTGYWLLQILYNLRVKCCLTAEVLFAKSAYKTIFTGSPFMQTKFSSSHNSPPKQQPPPPHLYLSRTGVPDSSNNACRGYKPDMAVHPQAFNSSHGIQEQQLLAITGRSCQRYYFCCGKSLLWQGYFCCNKKACFVATNTCLSRQTFSRRPNFCRDKNDICGSSRQW